jgi:hypothetical protein
MPKAKKKDSVKNSATLSSKILSWGNTINEPHTVKVLTIGFFTLILLLTIPLVVISTVNEWSLTSEAKAPPCTKDDLLQDETKPSVSIETPAEGSYIKGDHLTIKVRAIDNVCVKKVTVLIDGSLVKNFTSLPYNYTWNLKGVSAGTHTISARAADASDNISVASTSFFRSAEGLVSP